MTEAGSAQRVLLRLAPMIYGPTVLFALGEGAVVPLIPILAGKLGAELALSGLIAATVVIGQFVGNLPAGWLVSRVGERRAMLGAAALALVGVAGLALAPNLVVLAAAVFLIGLCAATYGLARHAFMTVRVPFAYRARALALLGGSFRLGLFLGPFSAGLLLTLTGSETSAAWAFGGCLIACLLLVGFGPDPESSLPVGPLPGPGTDATPDGVLRTMVRHREVLARLGLAASSLSAVRSARQVVLPLWGIALGLDAHAIAFVVGIAGAVDFALFYASGQVMDRFGRLWAALPAMVLMGGGFLLLSLTQQWASATAWYVGCAAVIGLGNGLSSGILMTLGADVAPPGDPAAFLGSWRTLTDGGGALAPVLFSGIAGAVSIGVGTAAIGAIALLGAVGFARWVPRFVPRNSN
ncbi:MAG: MFS transporter [Propionicimonas sp.]